MRGTQKISLIVLMVVGAMVSGCNLGASDATPTLSSDDVILTAQAIAELTRAAETDTPTPTDIPPTATITPTQPTNTLEPTGTPGQATLTANYNAFVRTGPGENYDVVDFLLAGQSAQIIGRYDLSPIGIWWYIQRETGRPGWIWSGAVTTSGNVNIVPAFTPPPSPTPGPTSTPGGETETPTPTPTEMETPTT